MKCLKNMENYKMNEELIKYKYKLNEIKNTKDSLEIWYNEMINKSESELSLLDINRMFRQNVLVELALDKAIIILLKDPFAGESTNGDVLENMLVINKDLLKTRTDDLKKVIIKADNNKNNVAWWYPEEKDEYFELIDQLKKAIK